MPYGKVMGDKVPMAGDDGSDNEVQHADAAILRCIVEREPRGVEMLYDRYAGVAYALAVRILRDPGAAEDVVQEAFLNVWRGGATYDTARGTVRTWLLTVVHHRAIDRLRTMRAKTRGDVAIDDLLFLQAKEDTWATVSAGLEGEQVRRAVATLPPEQRQVVEMAYFAGLTHVEIAERVGIPLGTVKGRMRLAMEKLRDALSVPGGHGRGMEFSS